MAAGYHSERAVNGNGVRSPHGLVLKRQRGETSKSLLVFGSLKGFGFAKTIKCVVLTNFIVSSVKFRMYRGLKFGFFQQATKFKTGFNYYCKKANKNGDKAAQSRQVHSAELNSSSCLFCSL